MAEAAKDDMSNRAERRDKGRSFVGGEGGREGAKGSGGMTDGRKEREGRSLGRADNDGSGGDNFDGGVGLVRSDGALVAHVRN